MVIKYSNLSYRQLSSQACADMHHILINHILLVTKTKKKVFFNEKMYNCKRSLHMCKLLQNNNCPTYLLFKETRVRITQ